MGFAAKTCRIPAATILNGRSEWRITVATIMVRVRMIGMPTKQTSNATVGPFVARNTSPAKTRHSVIYVAKHVEGHERGPSVLLCVVLAVHENRALRLRLKPETMA